MKSSHHASQYGTDEKFREWIRTQPSCLDGNFSEYVNGEGRNICAHVKRARNGGTAHKPEYSCVPLTNDQHMMQHQKGEASAILHYEGSNFDTEAAKNFFDNQAQIYLHKWIESRRGVA